MTTRFVIDSGDSVWLDHEGVIKETDKAKLYKIHGVKKWIPKCIIVDEGDEQLGVKSWWATENGIESDW
jgi:hypothetical protein